VADDTDVSSFFLSRGEDGDDGREGRGRPVTDGVLGGEVGRNEWRWRIDNRFLGFLTTEVWKTMGLFYVFLGFRKNKYF
jgi:hypothetical protein